MLFYLNHFITEWILPPGINLLIGFIGYLLWKRTKFLGKFLVFSAFLSLWILSTPIISRLLINSLQYQYSPLSSKDIVVSDKKAAIVVLEAGLNLATPEYNQPTVSEHTLVRLRYAAYLFKKLKTPILVSGNDPTHPNVNQTDYMANALQDYFSVPTNWKEDEGYNTALEGILTTKLLKKTDISKIYLVTHAYHMPRSVYSFQNKGIEIIPAPTGYFYFNPTGKLSGLLPSMEALNNSALAIHEYIGLLWYKIHYQF